MNIDEKFWEIKRLYEGFTTEIISGVYLICGRTNLYYVGQSQDIHYRLKTHDKKNVFKKLKKKIYYIPSLDKKERLKIESYFVRKYSPILNNHYDMEYKWTIKFPIIYKLQFKIKYKIIHWLYRKSNKCSGKIYWIYKRYEKRMHLL